MIMRLFALLTVAALFLGAGALPSAAQTATPPAPGSFMALCYHNVEDQDPDQTYDGVSTSKLIEQLSWLQHEGYTAVSVDDLLAARNGRKALPEKAVLLTFDDGYESFYTRVYPVLRAFHFPAVVAVVDEWMTGTPGHGGQAGDRVHYGDSTMPRSAFLTWAQLREMKKSGLIEVASHSHAMHYGVLANPQGNSEPDALTSIYDPATGAYESSASYIHRLQSDAAASVKTITHNLGKAPRVMVWPYGAYNEIGMLIQNRAGMPITMSLEDGYATVKDLKSSPRMLIKDDPSMSDYSILMRQFGKIPPLRTIEVDLDDVYNADADQEALNVDALVSRVYSMGINTVFLKAFADPSGTGIAGEVYFPNRILPVRQDLFNRIAWQLKTRTPAHVYGWLPIVSYDFGSNAPLSDTEAHSRIVSLYEDFGRNGPVDGLLFRDIALTPAVESSQSDVMIAFTKELASHVAAYRAPLKTVRVLTVSLPMNPANDDMFTQSYDRFLDTYDYTAIEATSDEKCTSWNDEELDNLVALAAQRPMGLKKTVFELQAVDGRDKADDHAKLSERLGEQMKLLARRGALNFGYYPDDFSANVPDVAVLHKDFSLQAYPYLP